MDRPLAERMRPGDFDSLIGQEHILGEGKPLRKLIEEGKIPSMIFWGPPGSGKTTVANIIAEKTGARFFKFSAVLASIKEVRSLMQEAEKYRESGGKPIVVFIDEIHRFNKAQQDAFLPFVESGAIVLIGATTENPSFEVIGPLLSRCRVFTFSALGVEELREIIIAALSEKEKGLGETGVEASEEVVELIIGLSDGDARRALNILEIAVESLSDAGKELTTELINEVVQTKTILYDKAGEEHFNLISALHKSMRNSDVDASLYWLARMLESGEDPLYIARRMVRFASEDVGMADPNALNITMSARDAVHFIGMPEGALALAEAVVYLALAPRSNSLYSAYKSIQQDIRKYPNEPVPLNIRNAPTRLMKELGYGKDYKYAHDFDDGVAEMSCLPERLQKRKYYTPTERGKEKIFKEKMRRLEMLRNKNRKGKNEGKE